MHAAGPRSVCVRGFLAGLDFYVENVFISDIGNYIYSVLVE